MTNIWWIRRDVRIHDQPALQQAVAAGPVLPLFVLDPWLLSRAPKRRTDFLFANLEALDSELRKRGSYLTVRAGNPEDTLPQVMAEAGATAVFAEEDFTPYARRRDRSVARVCDLRLVTGQGLFHPREVLKRDGEPYLVYTPFSRAWKKRLPRQVTLLPAPQQLAAPPHIRSDRVPTHSAQPLFPAGEAEARRRLDRFLLKRISEYVESRDRMDLNGTSGLSPYLRFGVLSMRTLTAAALQAQAAAKDTESRDSAERWMNELIWREFYVQILYHFPHAARGALRREYTSIQWSGRDSHLDAWKNGTTGVPIVDAGMRQLQRTGWMHNRARMLTASYLVKDLLIDWRLGERWFMENLIDGDPSANNGGWQWTAGTGTDAAPYFRIFNPVLQGRRFDPKGDYVRQWVPELAHLDPKAIHAPWEQNLSVAGYPKQPLVDHAAAVKRARLAYETARDRGSQRAR